jgi:hypothetical protein
VKRRTSKRSTKAAPAKPRAGAKKRQSPQGPHTVGLTFDDLRCMAREFPGIEESTSYGTAALKVRGTLLIRLKEDGETVVLKTTFIDRDLLLHADPEVYFITDHYRNYPYVLVRLPRIRAKDMHDRLEEAWTRER